MIVNEQEAWLYGVATDLDFMLEHDDLAKALLDALDDSTKQKLKELLCQSHCD